jgi:DNA mismatch repair protein MutH
MTEELLARARLLVGASTGEIAARVGVATDGEALRTKGTAGAVLERALGATGSGKEHDFPDLGIELKTIPVDENQRPIESTYVCTLSLADADEQEWETSWVRAKLARVLFVPLVGADGLSWQERRVGTPLLWCATREQEAVLRADFDDVVGLVGIGRIEELTAHRGR